MPAGATWTRRRRWPPLVLPGSRPRRPRRWPFAPATCWTACAPGSPAQGYRWHAVRITGALQEQVERAFQLHLAELGFNVGYDLLTDHERAGLFWRRQIQWLKGGDVNVLAPDPALAALARPAWAAYPTWAYHPYSQARALAAQARRHSAQRRSR